MKKTALFAAAIALVFTGAARAADQPKTIRAEVIFDHPENFTDIKDKDSPTEKGQQAILDEIRDYLVFEARNYIPKECKLTITFTDIGLAGNFEPWRGPPWDSVRIVKSIYPPSFAFSWKVTDAAGRVVKQGREKIRDLSFDMRVTIDANDRLHYEKGVLGDWMGRSLRGVKHALAKN